MGPVLRRWTSPAPSPVCCSFSCIAQGSRGLSLRGRGSRICQQTRRCCCGWFSQDLWVLHITICIPPETNCTINKIVQEFKIVIRQGLQLSNRKSVNTILYADDQILMATSEEELQTMAYRLNLIA